MVDDLRGLAVCLADDRERLILGVLEVLLATVSRRQPFGDLLLTGLDGAQQRRPYELPGEGDQDQEGNGLTDQSRIDLHSGSRVPR